MVDSFDLHSRHRRTTEEVSKTRRNAFPSVVPYPCAHGSTVEYLHVSAHLAQTEFY